jgi:tellurite resistance protein TehA-like permease
LQWTIGLPPGSFGIVMASGIISVAAHDQRRDGVSAALAITAAVVWMGLLVLTAARVVLAADLVRDDLQSPAKRFDFFTLVAAAGVLGVRAAIARWGRISVALSLFGALAWLVVALSMAMHRRSATPAWWSASGNWLLAVVATQSLAVVAGTLAGAGRAGPLQRLALTCWVIGLTLYALLIVVIGARVLGTSPPPARFTPDDWIVMGALAISTVAATGLLGGELADRTRALLADAAVLTWAVASSLLVPLAVLHLRGLLRDRAARRYQTRWWAAVFPLGMYSVATHQLAATLGMQPLESLAGIAFWAALGAWSLTAALAVGSARSSMRPSS